LFDDQIEAAVVAVGEYLREGVVVGLSVKLAGKEGPELGGR